MSQCACLTGYSGPSAGPCTGLLCLLLAVVLCFIWFICIAAVVPCSQSTCLGGCFGTIKGPFCLPVILPNSLTAISPVAQGPTNTLTLNGTRGGETIQFTIDLGNISVSNVSSMLYARPPTFSYSCTHLSFLAVPSFPHRLYVRCVTAVGVGRNLRFFASGCVSASIGCFSINGSDSLTYPLPSFKPHTLRLAGAPTANYTSTLVLSSSLSTQVSLDGTNFVANSAQMSVTYGLVRFSLCLLVNLFCCMLLLQSGFQCSLVSSKTSYGTLTCATTDFAQGSGLHFYVTVDGQTVTSADVLSYPSTAPVVRSIFCVC